VCTTGVLTLPAQYMAPPPPRPAAGWTCRTLRILVRCIPLADDEMPARARLRGAPPPDPRRQSLLHRVFLFFFWRKENGLFCSLPPCRCPRLAPTESPLAPWLARAVRAPAERRRPPQGVRRRAAASCRARSAAAFCPRRRRASTRASRSSRARSRTADCARPPSSSGCSEGAKTPSRPARKLPADACLLSLR
jgi:hypothetical protein